MSESQPFIQSPCKDEPFGCDSFMSDERYHVSDGPVSSVTQNANLYDISGMATGCESGQYPVPVFGASARMG